MLGTKTPEKRVNACEFSHLYPEEAYSCGCPNSHPDHQADSDRSCIYCIDPPTPITPAMRDHLGGRCRRCFSTTGFDLELYTPRDFGDSRDEDDEDGDFDLGEWMRLNGYINPERRKKTALSKLRGGTD